MKYAKAPLSSILSEIFRDGQLFFISGRKGSGKTLFASTVAFAMQMKFDKVLANFKLYYVDNFEPLTKYSQIKDAERSLIIIDESYEFFNSRTANSKANRLFNEIVAKARKKQNVYLLITHSPRFVDKTLRIMSNGVFFPSVIFETQETSKEGIKQKPKILNVTFIPSYEGLDAFLLEEAVSFAIRITDTLLMNYNTYEMHFEIEFDLQDKKKKQKKRQKRR